MRKLAAIAIASTFAAGVASAQMKVPPGAQPQTSTSPVRIEMNNPQVARAQAEASLESARRIERDEAIKLVKAQKAVFVDVRLKDTYDTSHIKGAISIPLSEMMTRLKDLPKNKMIITYCAWEAEHTSARAVLDLNAKGIRNAAALLGGWTGWIAAREPVESTPVKK